MLFLKILKMFLRKRMKTAFTPARLASELSDKADTLTMFGNYVSLISWALGCG